MQKDIETFFNWCEKWGMELNIPKCVIVSFCRSKHKISYNYSIDGSVLSRSQTATYLGVVFHETLSWTPHIELITKKANTALYFIKRAFSAASIDTKCLVYKSLVRS